MKFSFRVHAHKRMALRGITAAEVEQIVATGKVIEDYPNAKPLPARLILGWTAGRPLHVVAGFDFPNQIVEVISTYEPDPKRWDQNFSVRRPKP